MQLPEQLVQAIINYLVSKPYGEVNGFINELAKYFPKNQTIEQPKEVEETTKE